MRVIGLIDSWGSSSRMRAIPSTKVVKHGQVSFSQEERQSMRCKCTACEQSLRLP